MFRPQIPTSMGKCPVCFYFLISLLANMMIELITKIIFALID